MCSVAIAIMLVTLTGQCSSMLTNVQQEDIVNLHNQLRQLVASGQVVNMMNYAEPQAANMHKLVWNQALADGSLDYAKTCPNRTSYGENYGSYKGHDGANMLQINGLINGWFEEIKQSRGILDTNIAENAAQYTTLVHAKSTQVGCGFAECANKMSYLVCRYSPGGISTRDEIYKIGRACSACNTNCVNDALCA